MTFQLQRILRYAQHSFDRPIHFEGLLTGQRYLQFLREELPPLLEDVPLDIRQGMYFQHDGALPHFSREVVNYLNRTFTER